MADDSERRGDAETLAAGYEQLRASVLSGAAGGWRLGHAVLSTRGMTGWMSAFGELAPLARVARAAEGAPPAASASGSCAPPPADRPVSPPDAGQVVAVLAQMTLALAA